MLYSTFCYAFPQSKDKFQAGFREHLLQTCSRWICGISVRPNLPNKWLQYKLEPPNFRCKKHQDEESESDDRQS